MQRRSATSLRPRKAPECGGNLGGRSAERSRRYGAKLLLAAEAPQGADGRYVMPARPDDVVLAIAPHDAVAGVEPTLGKDMGDELALVLAAAVELRAVNRLEVAVEAEAVEDARGINGGLGGAENEPRPGRLHLRQRLVDPFIDRRLEKALRSIARAIDGERLLGVPRPAQHVRERPPQRRADDPGKIGARRGGALQGRERKAETADDALGGVGQRPVQVDEENAARNR